MLNGRFRLNTLHLSSRHLQQLCVCVPHVVVPQSQSTGVLFPAERPRTPGPARRQRPAGQSSGRVAAEMQRPQPAGDTSSAAVNKFL